jgi:hypothetical protein
MFNSSSIYNGNINKNNKTSTSEMIIDFWIIILIIFINTAQIIVAIIIKIKQYIQQIL